MTTAWEKQMAVNWARRVLDDSVQDPFWKSLWERQGKMRCVHCGRPIYCDDGAMGSGYYFHIFKEDGMNGLYCSAPFGSGKQAYPIKDDTREELVAKVIIELLGSQGESRKEE